MKFTTDQENSIRTQIKAEEMLKEVAEGKIKELNQMLIDAGLQPEPSIFNNTRLIISGALEQTGRGLKSIADKFKTGYREAKDTVSSKIDGLKTAGEERNLRKEIEEQIEKQMEAVRDRLHNAGSVQKQ